MTHDRESAGRLAFTCALRAGFDPFESSLEAGVADATAGRIFGHSSAPYRAGKQRYLLGYELGRFFRHDWQFAAAPTIAEAVAIVERLKPRVGAVAPKPADWFSWKVAALELAGAAYCEAAAMTWHAAGRAPFDYAADAKRRLAEVTSKESGDMAEALAAVLAFDEKRQRSGRDPETEAERFASDVIGHLSGVMRGAWPDISKESI